MKPPTFRFVSAHLRVASLARAEAFYAGVLGFHASRLSTGELGLHPTPDAPALIVLREINGLTPAPADAAGLFHLALLVPTRADLARVLRQLAEKRYPIEGLSDHGVSEAIYLADPDGNGLELYADRPQGEWPRKDGRLAMFTRALDIPQLLASAPDESPAGLPAGTTLGHVHLRVNDLTAADRFATTDLGLTVTTRDYPGAIFFAADGYHHHLATNTWGVRPPASRAPHAGLDSVQAAVRGIAAAKTIPGPGNISFDLTPA